MRRVVAAVASVALGVVMLTGAATTPTPQDSADPVRAAEYWLDQYGITEAWKTTRGAGQKIAIIDTGIARGPVEFSGAVVGGTDVSGVGAPDGRTPVGAVDSNHGSWVGSLAAARGTGDGKGMIGVAPEAELLSISVGFGSVTSKPFTEQIVDALHWAVDQGATVINMSLTTNTLDWDQSWDEAFQYAFDHDVVVVVAAGNRGSGTSRVGAPATIPGVLAVGGVDPSGIASNDASTQGITIGLSAPSERLLGVSADGSLVQWNGTSGAAPIVSGIAALVRAAHPGLDADNVLNRLIRTAKSGPGAGSGQDKLYGYGLVDAAAAVSTASVPSVSSNPLGDLAEWVRLYRRANAPAPTGAPTTAPVEIPALPPVESAPRASSPLLPTRDSLLYGTLPLAGATLAAIMITLGVSAAARRIRKARISREPSRTTNQESLPS
ncbi:MAG: peptidase S8 [Microbacterium sp. 71-36]|uniref:S8 family serine peptidase n=1 Tax=unclassified Microbacterium TaxID=2609290 RepID=UPI0008689033|nr:MULTISPECIES: S8 family serine peptidase [unclassified Microbacterium]MBN9210183.1 S8 family serine peptidase [Microbacterium sp.]ODT42133.1 MAG: peptidase S8 [Microbacterium sp. SCN 71-17]OJV77425.1 MAG: peptidase S8 [Microbacterium sp. 71-36]